MKLDEIAITITSASLRTALSLSAADRRWIDFLSQTVSDTWDPFNPSRPRTLGYLGSEEFIRLQFEEYLLALLSATKYHLYLSKHPPVPGHAEGDPITDFNPDFLLHWQQTSCYALFDTHTDSHLFDIVEPRHPTAGNLTFDDIQRRIALQIQELNLDDRLATGKEALNKHLATGQEKVYNAFTKIRADVAAMQKARRERAEAAAEASKENRSRSGSPAPDDDEKTAGQSRLSSRAADIAAAQASVQTASQKAGAYISSWGAWASERRKGWTEAKANPSTVTEKATRGSKRDEGHSGSNATRSPAKLARWSSSASLTGTGKRVVKEEKGNDGIGRLDA